MTFQILGEGLPVATLGGIEFFPKSSGGYDARALSIPNNLAYWPLRDAVEPVGRVAVDLSPNGFDGLYFTGGVTYDVTGPDGTPAVNLDGTGNVCVYSAGLAGFYNAAESSFGCFVRIAASEWADATTRTIFAIGNDASLNFIALRKTTALDQVNVVRRGGGAAADIQTHTFSPQNIGYFHIGFTVSESSDRMRLYINGVQSGADITSLDANVGGLSVNRASAGSTSCLGAFTPGINDIGRMALYDRELNAAEMRQLGTI